MTTISKQEANGYVKFWEQEQREKAELRLQVRLVAAGACGCIMNDSDEIPQIDFAHSKFKYGVECMFEPDEEQGLYADYSSIDLAVISLFSRGIRAIKAE